MWARKIASFKHIYIIVGVKIFILTLHLSASNHVARRICVKHGGNLQKSTNLTLL